MSGECWLRVFKVVPVYVLAVIPPQTLRSELHGEANKMVNFPQKVFFFFFKLVRRMFVEFLQYPSLKDFEEKVNEFQPCPTMGNRPELCYPSCHRNSSSISH